MEEEKIYSAEFTTYDLESLSECLAELRKMIADSPHRRELFESASKLHYKIALIKNPDSKVTLKDFTEYGEK